MYCLPSSPVESVVQANNIKVTKFAFNIFFFVKYKEIHIQHVKKCTCIVSCQIQKKIPCLEIFSLVDIGFLPISYHLIRQKITDSGTKQHITGYYD